MAFDEALFILLSGEGRAMKTPDTIGYFARTSVPEGKEADYCIVYVRPKLSQVPHTVFLVDEDGDEFLVEQVSASASDITINQAFARLMLSDSWYSCTQAECEEALRKMGQSAGKLTVDGSGNVTADSSDVNPDGTVSVETTEGTYDPDTGTMVLTY